MHKSQPIDERVAAIRETLSGVPAASPSPGRAALADVPGEVRSAVVDAHTLEISPRTVGTYRARLQQKPGINDLTELVRFAIRAGLVSPES